MFRAVLLALVVLAAPLAGCLGGDGGSDEGLDVKERAEVTEDSGGIEGVVTNPAVEPIEGAAVTIEETGEESTTASDGSFAFSEVPPGTYTLQVEAEGFLDAERQVDVAASEVTTIDVVLTEQPDTIPYMQQFESQGFMECSVGASAVVVVASYNVCEEGGNTTNTNTEFTHQIEPDPWQVVTEVDWEPSSPLADRFWMNVEAQGFDSAWKVAFANAREEGPIVTNTDRAQMAGIVQNFTAICQGEEDPSTTSNNVNNPDAYCNHNPIEQGETVNIEVLVQYASSTGTDPPAPGFPVGVGAAVQQEFTVFQTVFYHAPACEDYSLIEDNRCEQAQAPPEEDPYDEISGGNQTSGR